MALYDKSSEWYDWFVPGSNVVATWNSDKPWYNKDNLMAGNIWEFFRTFKKDKPDGTVAQNIGSLFNDLSGSSATNQFNAEQAAIDRQFNSAEALASFNRELEADSTKYQRTMADLQAAGINPLVAFGSLNPGSVSSSSATGAAASGVGSGGATIISAVLRGASQLVSSAIRAQGSVQASSSRSSALLQSSKAKNNYNQLVRYGEDDHGRFKSTSRYTS